jgi:Domain of unknown function (DUF6484)
MGQALMELILAAEPRFEAEGHVADDETLLEQMTAIGPDSRAWRYETPVVGVLWELDEQGLPLVCFDGVLGGPVQARSTVPLDSSAVGRDVVLLFDRGDPAKPLIMGVLRAPQPREPIRTEVDGEKLVFTAEREIVLRCGEASITLTRAGKVLIQGAYVLTRSSGANRIKGASVEIN